MHLFAQWIIMLLRQISSDVDEIALEYQNKWVIEKLIGFLHPEKWWELHL